MTKNKFVVLCLSYSLILLSLFLYSFTQVDLNLTLSQSAFFQNIQKSFTYIGYFNRPLSSSIYVVLLISLFTFYFFLITSVIKKAITFHQIKILILLSLILVFSYPAFSYDIFNYMFDAKTVAVYQANPWVVKPLDFVGDPWLRFMHWVHRPSVYPPVWIGISLVPFVLGFNKFVLVLLNFKIFIALFHLLAIYLLKKIMDKINPERTLMVITLFAFSPLVIIEDLVNGHNDIVMVALALFSIYLLMEKKIFQSTIILIFSVLTKYVTAFLLPVWIVYLIMKKKNKEIPWQKFLSVSALLAILSLLAVITKIEIQPWYLLWVFPFVLLAGYQFFYPILIGLSLGLLLRYLPFLYLGDWNAPAPAYKFYLTIIPLTISFVLPFLLFRKNDKMRKWNDNSTESSRA